MPADETRRENIYDLTCRMINDFSDLSERTLHISADVTVAETEDDLITAVKDLISVNFHLIDCIGYITNHLEDFIYDYYTRADT